MSTKSNKFSIWRKFNVLDPIGLLSGFCFSKDSFKLLGKQFKFIIEQENISFIITNNDKFSWWFLPINSSHLFFHLVTIFFLIGFCIKDSQGLIISCCNKLLTVGWPSLSPKFTFAVRSHYCFRLLSRNFVNWWTVCANKHFLIGTEVNR